MATIVEYTLAPTVPSFIIDGGYWFNPDGSEKMIGIGRSDDIPDAMTAYNLAELQARQRAIHANYPMKKTPNMLEDMTDDEVNAAVKAWVDERS